VTAFQSGDTVGRYRILRPLGAGAMGVVYLAQDPQIERLLAIKTVRPAEGVLAAGSQVTERHERLLREARTVGRLIHPNIVTLFDAGEQDGLFYLAFEYVEGSSLEQRLRAGEPVTTAEALRLAREVAEGLAYAHAQGIVHRDVKPANLLLSADGRIKISDFGIAKVVGQATELTLTGTVVGSPHYLSPEQVRGEELDGRSDLFSLGVVLYELLGGRRPFEGETLTTLVYQILHQEPPPIELRPELDPEGGPHLSETLARLLAKDREQRFADGHRVAAALAELERGLPAEVLAAPAVVPGDVAPTRLVTVSGAVAAPVATRPGEVAGEPAATRLPPGANVPPPQPPPPATPAAPTPAPAAPARAGGRSRRLLVAMGVVLLLLALGAGLRAWHRFSVARVAELGAGSPAERPPATPASGTQRPGFASPAEPPSGEASPPPEPSATGGPTPTPAASQESAPASASPPSSAEPQAPPEPRRARKARPEPAPERPVVRPEEAHSPAGEAGGEAAAGGDGEAASKPLPLRQALRENPALRREVKEMRAEKAAGLPPVDQKLDSGLALTFRVEPEDAFVLLDGTVLGRAEEHGAGRDPYVLPGAGTYMVKLRSPGMEDYRVLVRASAAGSAATVLSARLEAAKASELDFGDLELHRVREAIGFQAYPPTAQVLVDGKPVGRALRYSGRFARSATWLHLASGRHRVSVVAPGFRRRDFAVDVSAGASEAREKIEVRLARVE
jgi:serine/threonine-protein kinase